MVYFYDVLAGNEELVFSGDNFMHLRARRLKCGDRIDIRNLKDGYNYIYEVVEISKKEANLELIFKNSLAVVAHDFTIAWAVVENSVIEKTLPSLNEMGVGKILFVYSDFSQNIKLDLQRFERILIASSTQCGRNSIIEFEIFKSSDELLKSYQNISLIDFGGKNIDIFSKDEIAFVGAEGGFSNREREMFKNAYALNSPYILRSNSAVIAATAKLLF